MTSGSLSRTLVQISTLKSRVGLRDLIHLASERFVSLVILETVPRARPGLASGPDPGGAGRPRSCGDLLGALQNLRRNGERIRTIARVDGQIGAFGRYKGNVDPDHAVHLA